MKLYRQGDVLLQSISKLPKGKKRMLVNGVIAEGEVTGHMHRIENTTQAEVFEVGKQMIVSTPNGIRILHDEHDPLTLPAGHYKVVRQREAKSVGGTRRVTD